MSIGSYPSGVKHSAADIEDSRQLGFGGPSSAEVTVKSSTGLGILSDTTQLKGSVAGMYFGAAIAAKVWRVPGVKLGRVDLSNRPPAPELPLAVRSD